MSKKMEWSPAKISEYDPPPPPPRPIRVDRVLSLFSSRRDWDSPNPSPACECVPPPFGSEGRAHSLAREGLGESQFRRGDIHCGTLYYMYFVIYMYRNVPMKNTVVQHAHAAPVPHLLTRSLQMFSRSRRFSYLAVVLQKYRH
jgi:hypothetical protein